MARRRKRRKRFRTTIGRLFFGITFLCLGLGILYYLPGGGMDFLYDIPVFGGDEKYETQREEEGAKVPKQELGVSDGKEDGGIDTSLGDWEKELIQFAKKDSDVKEVLNNRESYPKELLSLLAKNKETKQFVLDYPKKKDDKIQVDISNEVKEGRVPLFLQWDRRWGYYQYGEQMMAINGCGPTCLSMVAVKVLGDTAMNPYWMAKYSEEKGYASSGATLWTLMSEGASDLGLEVVEIPPNEKRVADNLKVGNPIICIMGPGEFTTGGHFIVLTGYQDGMVTVNDPNSKEKSAKKWSFKEIAGQMRSLWVYR